MRHVKVIAKTIRDNTGLSIEIPTILVGVLVRTRMRMRRKDYIVDKLDLK